jgi:16S rRNA processing protein RimM
MPERRVLLGVIGRPHGVRGLVRVHCYAEDPAALPGYGPFTDASGRSFSLTWRGEGIAEISELIDGTPRPATDRDAAAKLVNFPLYVDRDRLPTTDADEFYVSDLVGLEAFGPDGTALGRVDAVHDYGGGVSLEIGRLLVPFTRAAVPEVDMAAGRITVVPPDEIIVEGVAA